MQISIDTGTLNGDEAVGLISLFVAMFGSEVLSEATSLFKDVPGAPVFQSVSVPEHTGPMEGGTTILQVVEHEDGPPTLEPLEVFGAQPTATAPLTVPTPPATGAVTTPPPPLAPLGGAVNLDTNGLPWDARIHAGTKTKTQKGAWTQRKGLADGMLEAVTAELRGIMGASPLAAPAVEATVPTPPSAPTVPVPPNVTEVASPPPAAPPPVAVANPFIGMMQRLTPLQTANPEKLSTPNVTALVESLGLQRIADLMQRSDLIPTFEALVQAQLA